MVTVFILAGLSTQGSSIDTVSNSVKVSPSSDKEKRTYSGYRTPHGHSSKNPMERERICRLKGRATVMVTSSASAPDQVPLV